MLRLRIPQWSVYFGRRRVQVFGDRARHYFVASSASTTSSSSISSWPASRTSQWEHPHPNPVRSIHRCFSTETSLEANPEEDATDSPPVSTPTTTPSSVQSSSQLAWKFLDLDRYPVGTLTWDEWDQAVQSLFILWNATKDKPPEQGQQQQEEQQLLPSLTGNDLTGLVRAQHLVQRLRIEAWTGSSASRRYLQLENTAAIQQWFEQLSLKAVQGFLRFYHSANEVSFNQLLEDLALVHAHQLIVDTIVGQQQQHTLTSTTSSPHTQHEWCTAVLETTQALVQANAPQPESLQRANTLLMQTPLFTTWIMQETQQSSSPKSDGHTTSDPSTQQQQQQQLIQCTVGNLFRTIQHNQPLESLQLWKFCQSHQQSHPQVWTAVQKMLEKTMPGSFDGTNLEQVLQLSLESSSLVTQLSNAPADDHDASLVVVERARKLLPQLERGANELILALAQYHVRLGQYEEATMLFLEQSAPSVPESKEQQQPQQPAPHAYRKMLASLIVFWMDRFQEDVTKGDPNNQSSISNSSVDCLHKAQNLFELWEGAQRDDRNQSDTHPSNPPNNNIFSTNPSWKEEQNRLCTVLAESWAKAGDHLKAAEMFLRPSLVDLPHLTEASILLDKAFVEHAEHLPEKLQALVSQSINELVKILDEERGNTSDMALVKTGHDILCLYGKTLQSLEEHQPRKIIQIYTDVSTMDSSFSFSREAFLSIIASVESIHELNNILSPKATRDLSNSLTDFEFLNDCIQALGVSDASEGRLGILDTLLIPALNKSAAENEMTSDQRQVVLKAASEKCLQWHEPEKALEYLEHLSTLQGETGIDMSSASILLQETQILKLLAEDRTDEALRLCHQLLVAEEDEESSGQGYPSSEFCLKIISLLASKGDRRCAEVLVWLIQLYHQSDGAVECKPEFEMFRIVLDGLRYSELPKGSPTTDKTAALAVELLEKMIQLNLLDDDSLKAAEKIKPFDIAMRIVGRTSDDVRFALAKSLYEKSARATGVKPDKFLYSKFLKAALCCKSKSPEAMEAQLKSLVASFSETRKKHKEIVDASMYSRVFRVVDKLASNKDPWMKGLFLACCQDGFLSEANRDMVRERVSHKLWTELYESRLDFGGQEPVMWSRNVDVS